MQGKQDREKQVSGIEVRDYVRQKCEEKIATYGGDISTQTRASLYNLKSSYQEFCYDEYMDYCTLILNFIKTDHPLRIFFNKLCSARNCDDFSEFCMKLGILESSENQEDLCDIWVKLMKKYPLFPRNSKRTMDAEHIKQYIEMCDGEK